MNFCYRKMLICFEFIFFFFMGILKSAQSVQFGWLMLATNFSVIYSGFNHQ